MKSTLEAFFLFVFFLPKILGGIYPPISGSEIYNQGGQQQDNQGGQGGGGQG